MKKEINDILGRVGGFFLERPEKFWLIHPMFSKNSNSLTEPFHLGQVILDWITVHTELKNQETVLDAGCGDGRVASALARQDFEGQYFGFDLNRKRMEALKKVFAPKKNFHFNQLDIKHSYYNPGGRLKAEDVVFPYPDQSMDLVFFNSIFTHLTFDVIVRNLREAARCLKPNGRVWATFFVIDEWYDPNAPNLEWTFKWSFGRGYTANQANPEKCVAFDRAVVMELFEMAGLSTVKNIAGTWKAPKVSLDQGIQDVIVAVPRQG